MSNEWGPTTHCSGLIAHCCFCVHHSLLGSHCSLLLLRLYLLDQPNQSQRDFVKRMNHSDLIGRARLARGACAVRAGSAASAVVVIEHVTAGAGIFSELHRLPSSFEP